MFDSFMPIVFILLGLLFGALGVTAGGGGAPKRRRIEDENVEESEEEDETDAENGSDNGVFNEDGADLEAEQCRPALPGNNSDEGDWEQEPDEEGNTPATDAEFEQYCDVINQHEQRIRKYGIIGYQTEFRIKDIEDEEMDIEQLCSLLKRIIQRLINEAVHNAEDAGIAPEWMGFSFKGEGMKKDEYLIPFRKVEHNTAEKLLQEIKNCAQSSSVADLIGKELSLKVTLHETPEEYREVEGAGMKESLKTRGSNVHRHALLIVPRADDNDYLCFFKAIVLAKQYHDTEKDYDKTKRLQESNKRLSGEARHLAAACGIQLKTRTRYGEKHAKAVQYYFELAYPGRYRLVIFSKNRGTTPVYNGGVNADINLCVYHEDDHFHAVKTPQKLFGCHYYCVACEVSFDRPMRHTIKCPIKCSQCLRMGREFPCKGNENIHCGECNKTFNNRDCYDEHLRLACKLYKQCPKCGDFWKPRDVDDIEHDCGAKKCGKCHAKHSGECFIVKPKLHKDRVYRIVAFDFECKVNKKGQDGKTPHEPNYLAAHITCTKCIDAGCWKDVGKKDCKVCGPEKLKVWPEWAYTERITMEFVEWLLRDLPKK
ncbi:Protein C25F9.2 protein [Aphelenchoides avenae]|nr:Protein C25F9.2 protein [Aphelenchus avenae]